MEYYIYGNSFAAPFFSDTLQGYVEADTPEEALRKFVAECQHPCGVFAAGAYNSADDRIKGDEPRAVWWSNHYIKQRELMNDHGAYSYQSIGPGRFKINNQEYAIDNPMDGRIIEKEEEKDLSNGEN